MEMIDTCRGKISLISICYAWEIVARSRRRERVWAGREAFSSEVWSDGEGDEEGKSCFTWLRSGSVAPFRRMFVLKVPAHVLSPGKS